MRTACRGSARATPPSGGLAASPTARATARSGCASASGDASSGSGYQTASQRGIVNGLGAGRRKVSADDEALISYHLKHNLDELTVAVLDLFRRAQRDQADAEFTRLESARTASKVQLENAAVLAEATKQQALSEQSEQLGVQHESEKRELQKAVREAKVALQIGSIACLLVFFCFLFFFLPPSSCYRSPSARVRVLAA